MKKTISMESMVHFLFVLYRNCCNHFFFWGGSVGVYVYIYMGTG